MFKCERCQDSGALSWICKGCEAGDQHMHTEPCPDCDGWEQMLKRPKWIRK